ncbi:hypothetical protein KC19_4G156700 [Ceratodon purpureus]|uniref:Uncharacterized protein n=1 Tax=Ceratodon purpureus TaxID=3225 RepID=A0A8T0I8Z6_CERPU|nr:hypothetical protein KC19_4G156700 [Ceratodon purpureus]
MPNEHIMLELAQQNLCCELTFCQDPVLQSLKLYLFFWGHSKCVAVLQINLSDQNTTLHSKWHIEDPRTHHIVATTPNTSVFTLPDDIIGLSISARSKEGKDLHLVFHLSICFYELPI